MTTDPKDALPPRLDPTCTCICHIQPGVMHFAPCCREADPRDAEIARLRAENEALRTGDWSNLRLVRFENGQFDFSGSPVQYIAEFFAQAMENGEGDHFNNMEIQFDHPKTGAMVLTVQRKQGLTPAEQRKKAEAERDAALAQVAMTVFCTDCENTTTRTDDDRCGVCGSGRIMAGKSPSEALSRRDAQMRAEGRKEGLREAAGMVKEVTKTTWIAGENVTINADPLADAILAAAEREAGNG